MIRSTPNTAPNTELSCDNNIPHNGDAEIGMINVLIDRNVTSLTETGYNSLEEQVSFVDQVTCVKLIKVGKSDLLASSRGARIDLVRQSKIVFNATKKRDNRETVSNSEEYVEDEHFRNRVQFIMCRRCRQSFTNDEDVGPNGNSCNLHADTMCNMNHAVRMSLNMVGISQIPGYSINEKNPFLHKVNLSDEVRN